MTPPPHAEDPPSWVCPRGPQPPSSRVSGLLWETPPAQAGSSLLCPPPSPRRPALTPGSVTTSH